MATAPGKAGRLGSAELDQNLLVAGSITFTVVGFLRNFISVGWLWKAVKHAHVRVAAHATDVGDGLDTQTAQTNVASK
jgi:hypothetical protein